MQMGAEVLYSRIEIIDNKAIAADVVEHFLMASMRVNDLSNDLN
jgi:hypothetical protein